MKLELDLERGVGKPAPLYRQVAEGVERLIESRHLLGGARLPTVRELARQLSVTPATVQSAYDELRRRGLIEGITGRGTFVRMRQVAAAPWAARVPTAPDMLRRLATLDGLPDVAAMAQGNGDPRFRPHEAYMRCLRAVEGDAADLLGYAPAVGHPGLRAELAAGLKRRDIVCAPDDLFVTYGVTHALDLVVSAVCRPGDAVLVESPTYLGFLAILRAQGVTPIPVPVGSGGADLVAVERALRRDRPRLFYTVPTFHNPTGACSSLEHRLELLRLADEYDLTIVEDDIYREIHLTGPPPPALKALDRSGHVIYLDGFSKTLMPGLRIGYVVPPPTLTKSLVEAHRVRILSGQALTQAALAEFLRRGHLDDHLDRTRPIYVRRREALMDALEHHLPPGCEWTAPAGGYSAWVTLPQHTDPEGAFRAVLGAGVAVAPGAPFLARTDGRGHLRLSFGGIDEQNIPGAVARLAGALRGLAAAQEPEPLADLIPLV